MFFKCCKDCGDVFVSTDGFEFLCNSCKKKVEAEFKDFITGFKSLLDKVFKKGKETNIENKKNDTVNDTSNDTVNDTANDTGKKSKCHNHGNAVRYCENNPAKIKCPKFGEKYEFLKKKYKNLINIKVARKMLEFVAREYTASKIAEIMNISEVTVKTYLSHLASCGLIVTIRKGYKTKYIMNPAIDYYLED